MESKSEKDEGAKSGETETPVIHDGPADDGGDDRVIVIEQQPRPEADQAYIDSYADLGRALARPDQVLDPDHPLNANQLFTALLQRPEPIRPPSPTPTT